ncbi:MAG: MarR family transcriptional regulator [Actinomycetales bacterium]|nr:MarR family transcriptional regulator [Actinomycetales bacterium]
MEDVVAELGHLTLGSRLRRVGERVQGATQEWLRARSIDVPAAQLPALAAVGRLGPLTVGELAQALRLTQPGVTRTVARLVGAGLVAVAADGADARVRRVALTPTGSELLTRCEAELWPRVDAAVAAVCAGLDGPLLAQLTELERAVQDGALARSLEDGLPDRALEDDLPDGSLEEGLPDGSLEEGLPARAVDGAGRG